MRIHIVSIAGVMTAYLAKALKQQGHIVTGSDQELIFPPVSNIIEESHIPFNTASIDSSIDLAIIGSSYESFSRTKNEFEQIKELKIPYVSATNYIAQNIGKKNSILIAGSFGKTTITGLVSQILFNANFNPSIMVGGQMVDSIDSVQLNNSDWSVIEADESIHGLDTQAKFLYYPVKYLILTSSNWEHKDSYKTEQENKQAFGKLIQKVPQDGIIIARESEKQFINSLKIHTPVYYYGSNNSDYTINSVSSKENRSTIEINTPNQKISVETTLIGNFNFENILSAVALADQLKIENQHIQEAVKKYKGIKRRLEMLYSQNENFLYDDFAQSPTRVQSTINAIKNQFPQHKIIAYFEPHAGFLQTINGISDFNSAFQNADKVILGKLAFNSKIDKKDRVLAKDYQNVIGQKIKYLPLDEDVVLYLSKSFSNKTVIINMSSGGLKNHQIIEKVINNLKSTNV